jgi:hypothetical protein
MSTSSYSTGMCCDNVRVLDLSDFIKHLEKNENLNLVSKKEKESGDSIRFPSFHPINRKNNSDGKDTVLVVHNPNPNLSILNTIRFIRLELCF